MVEEQRIRISIKYNYLNAANIEFYSIHLYSHSTNFKLYSTFVIKVYHFVFVVHGHCHGHGQAHNVLLLCCIILVSVSYTLIRQFHQAKNHLISSLDVSK